MMMTARMKMILIALGLYTLAAGALFGAWLAISYWPPAKNGDALANWILVTLGALVGHIFTVLTGDWTKDQPADAPKPTDATTLPAPGAAPAVADPGKPALPAAATGRISLPILAVVIMCAFALLHLQGCASLTQAGNSSYSFEPVSIDGKTAYKFTAADGKEYSARVIKASLIDGGFTIEVTEGASTAFQGQAIAGKALSLLPSFAPVLLPPGPALTAVQP
jgi:hypothetical protein